MHGQPFEPDGQRHLILDQAAKIAAGFVRTLLYKPRDRRAYFYEDSSWKTAFVGGSHEFLADRARLLDFRAMMHYVGTGITPAMTHAAVGVGSQYAYTAEDANGAWLEGAKDSTPTLPAPIPVKAFWAIDIYDTKPAPCSTPTTPTRASTTATAPAPPRTTATPSSASGPPHHRVRRQLAADRPRQKLVSHSAPLRALQSWFDQTWRPGDIQPT